MNTQGRPIYYCMFLKKGMLAKLAVTRAFFEGTLQQSRQGITALAAVKIEAYDLSGRWPWISRRFYKSTFLLFEKAYAAP